MKYKHILLCVFLFAFIYDDQAFAQSKTKPNIIFILTDDLGYGDIGVFYQNHRKELNDRSKPWTSTPNIDALAATGARLEQHYCAAPVCAPSRASLMMGVSQGHANIRDSQFDKALEKNYNMANVLHQLGYSTAIFGKWGLQGVGKGFAEWPSQPLNVGFDHFFGYMRHGDGHEHYPKEGLYNNGKPNQVWNDTTNITRRLDKCYTADLWTAAAKRWIINNRQKRPDKPFFVYLAYDTPHAVLELPTQAYPAGGGLTGGIQWLGQTGHMINTASGTIDSWVHPDYANATYDDNNPQTPEVPWPDTYKRYATAVRRIDSEVGDMMKLLKDLKIDSNTIIVFSSDNGPSIESYLPPSFVPNHPDFFNSFGPFDGIKRDCWEGGLRMPTIAAWPGHIPAGKVVQSPNAAYDWLPTFTDAVGVAAPVRTDGVSLLPALTGKGKQRDSRVYVEFAESGRTPGFKVFDPAHRNRKRGNMQVIRQGEYVGVRYDTKSADDNFEIYNVIKDPAETKDLAASPEFDKMQKQMKAQVLQMRMPNASAIRPYDSELVPPVIKENVKNGVFWQFFAGGFSWIPDATALVASKYGISQNPDNDSNKKAGRGMVCISGYIKVPLNGEYKFYLNAPTKAFLRIHEAAVIDADYSPSAGKDVTGKILLKAGMHPFRLYYLNNNGTANKSVKFEWEGPGIVREQIPANVFYRD